MSARAANSVAAGLRITGFSVGINLLLATGKIVAGILGNSYALIADGIESTADIFSSFHCLEWAAHRDEACRRQSSVWPR